MSPILWSRLVFPILIQDDEEMMGTGDPNKYKRESSTWNTRGTSQR